MTGQKNNDFEKKEIDVNGESFRRIVLTEQEVSEISKLYDTAIRLSEKTNPINNSSGQNSTRAFDSETDMLSRKKAWHDVQEYLDMLGKKYNYDPEKFVINKLTRELEPYKESSLPSKTPG